MKKHWGVALVGVLLLSGCAGQPEAEPTPTETESENTAACTEFADLTMNVADRLYSDNDNKKEVWESIRSDFDATALSASGVVQDRMLSFVDDWPSVSDILIYNDFDAFNQHIEGIARACDAEGVTFEYATLTT